MFEQKLFELPVPLAISNLKKIRSDANVQQKAYCAKIKNYRSANTIKNLFLYSTTVYDFYPNT